MFIRCQERNIALILTPFAQRQPSLSAIVTNTVNKYKLCGEPVYWDLEISNHTN